MSRPNVILMMCDDLGYGDTGFNGNTVIQTRHLDQMRREGARFTRFYAGGPVCSPTRGTCLTGRHYARYGITHANTGRLPTQEHSLPRIFRDLGYRCGHFGKWHLGALTTKQRDGIRGGPGNEDTFSPPWVHGYDTCFATEAKVPTWDPMLVPEECDADGPVWGTPGEAFGSSYWDAQGQRVTDNLRGDDSRVMVDRAEPFIRDSVSSGSPFFATVWFHAPHTPVVAGPAYRRLYTDRCEDEQHYFGCITAMDEQVGRLNQLTKELSIDTNTIIAFCSDNGPEGWGDPAIDRRNRGSTAGRRGRKRSLFNGGIEVPALLKWPGRVAPNIDYTMPTSTLDYLPTLIDELGYPMPDDRPIDGVSLLPLIDHGNNIRPRPNPFRFIDRRQAMFDAPTFAMIDNRYKFMGNLSHRPENDLVFDLMNDPYEQTNLVNEQRDFAKRIRRLLDDTMISFKHSHAGGDYNDPAYQPVTAFQDTWQSWWPDE